MTDYRFRPHRWRSPSALLLPPPLLHQRYKLDAREIGHGGCARVYPAWDLSQGKSVVLKRAHLSRKQCAALYAEAEVLSLLHHPAIPAFVEYFEEAGRAYLVEARMEGTPMKHLCAFDLAQTLWIGRQLCEILAYLHQRHLVHRDIAPGNLLIDSAHQRLALLDFGLARLEPSTTPVNAVPEVGELAAGTPGYVAPEQWTKGTVSPAADIYSLGMILGCALTDCEPKEVLAVRSFTDLWDDPQDIPPEILPLLLLLDRMLDWHSERRPMLSEVTHTLSQLEAHLFGTLS